MKLQIIYMNKQTAIRWAMHKKGTDQFGYMCLKKEDAEYILANFRTDAQDSKAFDNYDVVQVELSWMES